MEGRDLKNSNKRLGGKEGKIDSYNEEIQDRNIFRAEPTQFETKLLAHMKREEKK